MTYNCKLSGDCDYPCACPIAGQSGDEGTVFIERLEDGTVQLKVRSPGRKHDLDGMGAIAFARPAPERTDNILLAKWTTSPGNPMAGVRQGRKVKS